MLDVLERVLLLLVLVLVLVLCDQHFIMPTSMPNAQTSVTGQNTKG